MPGRVLNKLTIQEYQAIVTGIPKCCPNATFLVNGKTLTAADAVTFFTTLLNTATAVATAKTGLAGARLAESTAITQNGATATVIRDMLGLMFGSDPTSLAELGIPPKKPRAPLSIAARAVADAKAKATRAARGTKSKKQAAAITGNVVGVTIIPVTTGTAAASTASTGTTTTTTTAASTAPLGAVAVAPAATGTATTTTTTASTAPLGAVATGSATPVATSSSVTPATAPANGASTAATAPHS